VKINEIIVEGWGNVLKGLTKSVVGDVNYDASQDALSKATGGKIAQSQYQGPTAPSIQQGTVQLVKASNGQQYFKSYQGIWYEKHGLPDEYSITHPVRAPKDIEVLDKLAQASGIMVPVTQDIEGSTEFVKDKKGYKFTKRRGQQ
jgi:hypothetical protein